MTLKNKPKRNTGINCPFCMKGFIIDQRAYSVTKDILSGYAIAVFLYVLIVKNTTKNGSGLVGNEKLLILY